MIFAMKKKATNVSYRLYLRPLTMDDKTNVCLWMTNAYILQHSFVIPGPKSRPSDFSSERYALRYLDVILADHKRLTFAIIYNGQHVGNIGLKEMCKTSLTAECFIEVGHGQFRGQGIGKQAMTKLLHQAFYGHGLKRIDLDVLEFNFVALKLYDQLGFKVINNDTWHYDEYGQYWRVLRMSLYKQTWTERNR